MMDDKDVAADVEDTNPDLDAAINAALDTMVPEEDAPVEKGPARGPDGKFTAKTEGGDDAVAEEPADDEAETKEPAAEPEAVAPPKWTDGHFTGWKPEQREAFSKLSPDVQALVMERQAETQAFFQRKLAETDDFRKQAEPLYAAAKEVEPFARSIGLSPDALLRNYTALDYKLRYAPYQEKVQLFETIAREYGIPFAQPAVDPLADPIAPGGEAYPQVHDLQTQVARLSNEVNTYRTQFEQQSQQQIQQSIQAFASATNADGSPKYPYFDTVRATMGQLMTQGQAETLEDAYQKAVKPIENRIAADIAARQKAAEQKQAAIVAKAKKAAPVRSSGISPGGKTKGGSLDDVLGAALDAHGI